MREDADLTPPPPSPARRGGRGRTAADRRFVLPLSSRERGRGGEVHLRHQGRTVGAQSVAAEGAQVWREHVFGRLLGQAVEVIGGEDSAQERVGPGAV